MQRHGSNTPSRALRTLDCPLWLPAWAARGIAWTFLLLVVAASAVVTKEARMAGGLSALAELDPAPGAEPEARDAVVLPAARMIETEAAADREPEVASVEAELAGAGEVEPEWPADTRWFNGRPVRPVRTVMMRVTAYSPDARSCGDSADGITSSLHSVWTNNMNLVAADSKVLPLGSMITVPGYADDSIVPVLDRGGAIKGNRLDVLYPTHEVALQWGVKRLPVVVWEYADGLPADDFRAIRDSRN